MKIEPFDMERMQSTWENRVDYDLSESGIRPLTLRELVDMGLDLDAVMDVPLGYSQSNGTPELRELITRHYPGAAVDQVEVTNGTSEANYLLALTLLGPGDDFALEMPNYMQLWGLPRSLGARVRPFRLKDDRNWEVDWDAFDDAVTPDTRLVYLSHPNNPTGKVLSEDAMHRIVRRCEDTDTWLISDEVYLGAELGERRTKSFWGLSDRVIVTSGLSKAWGIPGIRIGWIVGPAALVAECWSQHDYITIGPNKLSDVFARVAVTPENRERCYARTRRVLRENLPLMQAWVDGFDGRLAFNPPDAGAITLMRYRSDVGSVELAARVRENQSVLIVPGAHLGLEGFVRIWMGGRPDYLAGGLARVKDEFLKVM
ncbi:MAG TPA: aminotransferase class I/II-fold pyridoxal phosphate-dependent enzyme [Planctomycetota bacterium]|nr:aminotransferase class I/II-fold pyridoxal phosphate-dependent enzyme [Planctomycetota bacterium]